MGWNKEFRPPADYFPNAEENPTPGGVVTGTITVPDVDLLIDDSDHTVTNLPSGETAFTSRQVWFNARGAVQVRGVIGKVTTAGSAGSKARLKYRTTAGGSAIDPGVSGATVDIPIDSTGPQKSSGWVNIDPDATNDVLWDAVALGGNGTADPVFGGVHAQFRYALPPLCLDGIGCPMPEGIYNGDDFSVARYADEATYIAFVEAESTNFYWSWYGDDGSVEGVSFDPDLTFCGNPVVVGRWVAVSDVSTIWDVIGWGSWTYFSNPIGDTGGSGSRVAFRSVWTTMRIMIESGWMADDGFGFTVSDLIHGGNGITGDCNVLLRDGRVIFRCEADSSVGVTEYDVGPASLIVGTADFVEITIHGVISDSGGGIWHLMTELFINPACSGGSAGEINTATPLATYDADVVPTPISGVVANFKFYNWDKFNYTSDSPQWPEKKIWVAQAFYSGSLT